MFLKFNPFRSMTVGGTVAALGVALVNYFEPTALGPTADAVLQGAGVLTAVLGLRNAQAKTVREVAKLLEALAQKAGQQ